MASRDPLEEEFREFVAARSGALLRTAYLLAGDWATAEDLLQTALTKTYLAWRRLGGIDAVEPYARRVLVNTSTSWWRRRWHGERPTDVLPESAAADEMEQQLDRDVLWRHLRALPNRQRAVLVLRYYEDLSEGQTAALLGISVGTVKSQTARALSTLRRRLGDQALPELSAVPAPRPERATRARPRRADRSTPPPAPAAAAPTPPRSGAPQAPPGAPPIQAAGPVAPPPGPVDPQPAPAAAAGRVAGARSRPGQPVTTVAAESR
ncbi:SigE family RNA polymerase sigma factor [Micromonospora fluostatini]|uniref:SigE family RNA polymerase sigma factor n=1 Tax=Micromonospora sp. JCM 30529 TaxID=3421643 RepID=UPI003D1751E6